MFSLSNLPICITFAAMFKKSGIFLVVLFSFTILLLSCSKHQKLLKSTDNELKYDKAVELYEKGDYYRALQLFEQLIPVYRGTSKAEDLYYFYAYAYYHEREWVMASYYFKRFTVNFPTSKYSEEAAFMTAYCKYLDSPRFSLDQTVTKEAIDEFQLFINKYPYGEKAVEATEYIEELRLKLQLKDYNIANLYFRMEDYQAAIVSFENLLKEYPDTEFKEDVLFNIISAYYNYAQNSIIEKQDERFESAVKSYYDFISLFPESKYRREVEKIRQQVESFLQTSNL
jgi:outer membrane protein assembly factor BamD